MQQEESISDVAGRELRSLPWIVGADGVSVSGGQAGLAVGDSHRGGRVGFYSAQQVVGGNPLHRREFEVDRDGDFLYPASNRRSHVAGATTLTFA